MRRSRALLASLAVLFGAIAAHLVDGAAAASEVHHQLEAAPQGHASSLAAPWVVTAVLVLGVAVMVQRFPRRPDPLLIALPFLAWAIQEASARVGGGESLPFESNSPKHIALGLRLQLPIALFIYLLVRVAVVVARKLVGSFVRPAPVRRDTKNRLGTRRGFVARRIPRVVATPLLD